MKFIRGDILHVFPEENKTAIICHQVNCLGVMGAGLAKQIAIRWPEVETSYKQFVRNTEAPYVLLGTAQVVETSIKNLYVANLFGQKEVRKFPGEKATDYGAVAKSLADLWNQLVHIAHRQGYDIYFPYGIGCGLGGGDVTVVHELIAGFFPEATIVEL